MTSLSFNELGFAPDLVPFHQAWDEQRAVHARVHSGEIAPTCLLVEHEAVYTAGRRTASWDRPSDDTEVIDVDRGGKITWHGPGQLVGYPIVPLPAPLDVVAYVRALEGAIIEVCRDLGVETTRVEGRSGVWVLASGDSVGAQDRKICAIGVRVAQGVTMHGFALNCNPDLSEFGRIVPCGLPDADVTSLTRELGRVVTIDEVIPSVKRHLTDALLGLGALPQVD